MDGSSAEEISAYLRGKKLRPLGVSFSFPNFANPSHVVVAIPEGVSAAALERSLNGLVPDDDSFPPPIMPADPPLNVATVDGMFELSDLNVPGEALPTRLVSGAAPNVGDGYSPATGGFDSDGDRLPDGFLANGTRLNGPGDELDIFWQHFFMDTFAGQRLASYVRVPVQPANRPGVAIVDTGLGDGTRVTSSGGLYDGIELFGITDCRSGKLQAGHPGPDRGHGPASGLATSGPSPRPWYGGHFLRGG